MVQALELVVVAQEQAAAVLELAAVARGPAAVVRASAAVVPERAAALEFPDEAVESVVPETERHAEVQTSNTRDPNK